MAHLLPYHDPATLAIRIGWLSRSQRDGSRQEDGGPCRCHGNDMRFDQHRNTLLDIYDSQLLTHGSSAHPAARLLFFYVGMDFISVSELSCEKNGRVLANDDLER